MDQPKNSINQKYQFIGNVSDNRILELVSQVIKTSDIFII